MPKFEPITTRFNRTDNRVYVICAVLWRFWRENKPIGQTHLSILFRRNLLCKNGQNGYRLTDLGKALAQRHESQFKAIRPSESKTRPLSEEHKRKLREGKERRLATTGEK